MRLDFNRAFLRQLLCEARRQRIDKPGTNADNGIRLFNRLTHRFTAGSGAVCTDKIWVLLIKQPFAHEQRRVRYWRFRHPAL